MGETAVGRSGGGRQGPWIASNQVICGFAFVRHESKTSLIPWHPGVVGADFHE